MINYEEFKKLITIISDRDIVETNVELVFGRFDESPLFDPFWELLDLYLLKSFNEEQYENFYDYVYSNYNNFTSLLNCDAVEEFYNYLLDLENE